VEATARDKLAAECASVGLWMRALFECGVTFGWRVSELLNLRVGQVDLADRTIRLNPGETKNGQGRLAVLTDAAYVLIRECVRGKTADDYVFTRNRKRIRSFRGTWAKLTEKAGLKLTLYAMPLGTSAAPQSRHGGFSRLLMGRFSSWRRTPGTKEWLRLRARLTHL
jgi:integrase